MSDDGIRERHGMAVRDRKGHFTAITVGEDGDGDIWIDGNYETRFMKPQHARYLARKLYRLARRIDARGDQP